MTATTEARYRVGAVANFFIGRSQEKGVHLTHLKLQKLVYIAHGLHLVVTDRRRLFKDRIEAWRFGPVVPALYHEFKRSGRSRIRRWSADFDLDTNEWTTPLVSDEDDAALLALNCTWSVYGEEDASELVRLTHKEGTPWNQTVKRHSGGEIPDGLIQEHYEEIVDGWGQEA